MSVSPDVLALLPVVLLLGGAILAAMVRDARSSAALATGCAAAALACALVTFGLAIAGVPLRGSFFSLDRVSSLILVLATGISTVVHAFSQRYMDGDGGYRAFFVRLSAITASVALVLAANDVVALAIGWIAVGDVLYRLQVHLGTPAARAAARPMRRAHLAGDAALVGAVVALAFAAHTTRIDALVAHAATFDPLLLECAMVLVAVAAFSKSAQMPFHAWLPDTMEAPTPVSALMHAGIVNAGGYLFVRFAPLVAHAPIAALAIVLGGACTALWGGSCMLVRPDVKRGLAYSTMAQMGYMTMQCGIGAFPAAIAHLTAHGIFKATLFLGSGYAVHDERRAVRTPVPLAQPRSRAVSAAAALVVAAIGIAVAVLPIGLPAYAPVLVAFLTMTGMQMTFASAHRYGLGKAALTIAGWAVILPLYAFALRAFDGFLAPDIASSGWIVPPVFAILVVAIFAVGLLLAWRVIPVPAALRDRAYVALLHERLVVEVA